MLSAEVVLTAVKGGRKAGALDGRDYARLTDFFSVEEWEAFGFVPKEGADVGVPKAWTRVNILAQLEKDVVFGFEKALDQRGISAGLMHAVVKMWLWILEDPLQHRDDYAQYGLPLLKAVAVKYGLKDEIEGDTGTEEEKYGEQH